MKVGSMYRLGLHRDRWEVVINFKFGSLGMVLHDYRTIANLRCLLYCCVM